MVALKQFGNADTTPEQAKTPWPHPPPKLAKAKSDLSATPNSMHNRVVSG